MKLKPILNCTALVASLAAIASPAIGAINVTGTMNHTENFDSLPTAAALTEFNWTDDTTIQGFYLHRTNNAVGLAGALTTAAGRPFIADGSLAANAAAPNINHHGVLSLGAYSDPERSLGFCPTTTDGATNWSGGTLSVVSLFTNTGTLPVRLTNVSYDLEAWRGNSGAANAETVTVTYKVGAATALLGELGTQTASATFNQPGYADVSTVASGSPGALNETATDGFIALAATASKSKTLSGAPTSAIVVPPGQSLIIRWGNVNEGGTDAKLGIDNFSAAFEEQAGSVTGTASAVARQDPLNTPNDPTDDTVSFDLVVIGAGAVGNTGWALASPSAVGGYGVASTITGVPIGTFTGASRTATFTIVDRDNAAISNTFTVTAPGCALNTPTADTFTYLTNGTVDSSDDTLTYQTSVTGLWNGPTYSLVVDTGAAQSYSYGTSAPVTGVIGARQTLNFTDGADAACRATLLVNNPGVIGTSDLGATQAPVISLPAFGDRRWTLDSSARTATQVSGSQVDHELLSEVINLEGIGAVQVNAVLDAIAGTDTVANNTGGFEALDHFQLEVIIDGGAPTSILGAADADGDGLLEGSATGSAELPSADVAPVSTPKIVKSFNFSGIVPAEANSLQIRIVGNSNSANETLLFKALSLVSAPAQINAAVAVATMLDNKDTISPDDDTWVAPVNITAINLGASTGWSSNLAAPESPLTGLYSTANPVNFNVAQPVAPATTRSITLADQADATKTASVTVNAPARTFAAALAATPNITRVEGNPGVEDDSVTFDITISGTNGGPQFALASAPGIVSTTNYSLTSTATTVTVTMSPVPAFASTVYLRVMDASYPASAANLAIAVPAPATPPTTYTIGQTNFGGMVDLLSEPAPPAAWQNFPGLRTLAMQSPANPDPAVAFWTVTSTSIDLQTVGTAQFSARLRTIDTSSGFEAADNFSARLIVDGNAAAPILSTNAFDTSDPKNGLEAAELSIAGGTLATPTVQTFLLSAVIPETANSVVLEIVGFNNSINEQMILDQVLFAPFTGPVDSDGDGMTDEYENLNGLLPGTNDASLDLDGDGQSNLSEFLAGTMANDPASTLKILDIVATGPGTYTVSIATVAGKSYQLEESTDLGNGDTWANLGAAVTATGPVTTSPDLPLAGGGERHFIRAKVVP